MTFTVDTAIAKLGADIRDARKRRNITAVELAKRLNITRVTLGNLERGDPNVRIGLYAAALQELGRLEALADAMDCRHDPVWLDIARQALGKNMK